MVTYGQVNASWKSDLSPVSPVKDFLDVSSLTVAILNVVRNSVTARQTYNYTNGTVRTNVWVDDIRSGTGNMSSAIPWIIAGSLAAQDALDQSSSASTIVQTVQGVYAGAVRTVNIINSTQPEPGGFAKFLRIWDQQTGFLLGFALNFTASNVNYNISASASTQMTGTSLWVSPAPTRTLALPLIVPIAVFLAAVFGSAGTYVLYRRRGRLSRTSRFNGTKYRKINTSFA